MLKTRKLVAILLMLLCTRVVAQNTLAAGGGNASESNGNTAYSIGQMFVDTYNNGSIQSVTGIVQPYEITQVLPLHWLNLTARLQNNMVLLEWTALDKEPYLFFDIEKQNNNQYTFYKIGHIDSKTNANSNYLYRFIDSNVYNGANYYRIKQVTASNQFYYSNLALVTVVLNELTKINVFPNPAATHIQINLQVTTAQTYQLQLQDANGRVLLSKTSVCIAGKNNITWNIAQLAAGTYYIKAIAPQTKTITLPIIKSN